MIPLLGIHHITALASDPQRNLDFYAGVLGMRFIKKTVNFDSPDVYHLYYADATGTPGTVLTFFPFPDAARGTRGTGEITALHLGLPASSLEFWVRRLTAHGIPFDGPSERTGEPVLTLLDPDGMKLDLVFTSRPLRSETWGHGPVPAEHTPRAFIGITSLVRNMDPSAAMLTQILGFSPTPSPADGHIFSIGDGAAAATVTLVERPDLPPARASAGSVHHIAWRLPDDRSQAESRDRLLQHRVSVTEIVDRCYFHSIYFREPGGVLFEIATDNPGFLVDETREELGTELRLPPWYEPYRPQIESHLAPIVIPSLITAKP